MQWIKQKIYIRLIIISFISFTTFLYLTHAKAASNKITDDKVSFELIESYSLLDGNEKIVSLNMKVINNREKVFHFNGYSIRLWDKKNKAAYEVYPTSSITLLPKNQDFIRFYSKVPKNVIMKNVELHLYKWDIKAKNYERYLGSLSLSSIDSISQSKTVNDLKSIFNISVSSSYYDNKSNLKRLSLDINIKNQGNMDLSIKDYKWFVGDANGSLYPLNVVNGANKIIPSKQTNMFGCVAGLPKTVNMDHLSLILTKSVNVKNISLLIPLSKVSINKIINVDTNVSSNSIVDFSKLDAKYTSSTMVSISPYLSSYSFLEQTQSRLLNVDILVKNLSNREIVLPERLNFILKVGNDTTYQLEHNIKASKLKSQGTRIFQVFGTIPKNIDINKLKLYIEYQPDESILPIMIKRYNLTAPKQIGLNETNTAQISLYHIIDTNLSNKKIEIQSSNTISGISVDDNKRKLKTQLIIKNPFPFQLSLWDHVSFTLTYNNQVLQVIESLNKDDLTVPANSEKNIELTIDINSDIDVNNLKLLIGHKINHEEIKEIPIDSMSLGFNQSNAKNFTVRLLNIQRVPDLENDTISIDVEINNSSSAFTVLSNIKGYILLDQNLMITSEVLKEKDSVLLGPRQKTVITVYGQIPHDLSFVNGQLTLENFQSETKSNLVKIGTISFKKSDLKINTIDINRSNKIGDFSINIIETGSYNLDKTDGHILAVKMAVKNDSNRSNTIPKLGGYFITRNGAILPAKVERGEEIIQPDGKAYVIFWTPLSEDALKGNIEFFSGVETKDNKLVKVYQYKLPPQTDIVEDNIIRLTPYTIQFNSEVKYDDEIKDTVLLYSFNSTKLFGSSFPDNSIYLEIIVKDNSGKIIDTKSFPIDQLPETPQKIILEKYGNFIEIYEKFEGGKRNIYTKSL
ncbi:hypothetical protein ACT3HK_15355 [Thermolongibacillus altinsuensis]